MKNLFLLIIYWCISANILLAQKNTPVYGITLCGAEFGEHHLPGILNKDYMYPTKEEINYFANKGVDLIQLPFKWERIQRALGGQLDIRELQLIGEFVDNCAKKNIMVTLVMQNFGRYSINNQEFVIGSTQVSRNHFRDVWRKIAFAMRQRRNIYAYSIMSEPHDLGEFRWAASAQEAIYGIREIDRNNTIIVDGDNYSGPETWAKYNDDLKYVVDPANNMLFNAHCYFDQDRTGHYTLSYEKSGANENTGINRIKPFINWLNQNNKKGFVGEFGVPKNDPRWLAVMDNFLQYLTANGIGGCYWAAGRWWKDYLLSIEPDLVKGDQPQMLVYAKHIQNAKLGWASNYTRNNYTNNK